MALVDGAVAVLVTYPARSVLPLDVIVGGVAFADRLGLSARRHRSLAHPVE